MSRKRLRKSDIKELNESLPITVDKKSIVEIVDGCLVVDNQFSFFQQENEWIPSLQLLLKNRDLLPKIVVDMGAVKFVANGADIMRPGITEIPDVEKNTIIAIVDENNGVPLAVGRMLFSGQEMREQSSGKVVQSLHFVGDALWKKFS